MKTKPLLLLLAVLLLVPVAGKATHINGGYISYAVDPQHPLKYKFTFTLYDNELSTAEDPEVQVSMGDLKNVTVARRIMPYYNNNSINIYEWEYTYQQPDDYIVSWNGINRNGGIVNIASPSDQLSQFIHTEVKARLVSQNHHSARTIVPAPLEAFIGEPFKMNTIAYDADGDDLFYQLIPGQHLDANATPKDLPGYQIPAGMRINQAGELNWENPTIKGEYALSIKITEYRNQQPVGYTIVDLNLKVRERAQEKDQWDNNRTTITHPRVSLVNQNRLTFDENGFVRAKADQPLKLEFYVEKTSNSTNSALSARHFSDVDTLDLAAPILAVRDSAKGLAVTVQLNTAPDLKPSYLYTIGLRGASRTANSTTYDYGWDFVSFYYGELQLPTAADEDLAANRLKLYPNPVHQAFVVEALASAAELYLFSAEGKKVHRFRLSPGSNSIARPAHLAPGLYTYQLIQQNGKVYKGKVMLE